MDFFASEDPMTTHERAEALMNRLLSGCRLAPVVIDGIISAVAAELEMWGAEERSIEREACAIVAETLKATDEWWTVPASIRIARAIRDRSEEA